MVEAKQQKPVSLGFLFWTFLKIGSIAWGGFMGLISVVQNEVVNRHQLISEEEMLDGISLATLLPGPIAVNVVAYCGYKLRGGIGALISTVAVILPTFLLLLGLTMAYFRWGSLPTVDSAFAGFIPAVAAIILNAAWGMQKKAIKGWPEFMLGITAAGLLLGIGGFYLTLGLVLGAGLIGWLLFREKTATDNFTITTTRFSVKWVLSSLLLIMFVGLFLFPIPGINNYPELHLLSIFSGMSLMLFGGGFVFIPLIQEVVVDGLHWVSHDEFVAAIAMGQITPGPILISAAFIGYKVAGFFGATIATIAIFFPSALLMIMASQALEWFKTSPHIRAALRGIRAVVVGLIFAAAIVIVQTVEPHWSSLVIFIATLLALMKFKLDIIWIIPTAGLFSVVTDITGF